MTLTKMSNANCETHKMSYLYAILNYRSLFMDARAQLNTRREKEIGAERQRERERVIHS